MTHAASVARSTMDETELEMPPARVWGAIAEELGLSTAVLADPLRDRGTQTMADAAYRPTDDATADVTADESEAPGDKGPGEPAAPGDEADVPDIPESSR